MTTAHALAHLPLLLVALAGCPADSPDELDAPGTAGTEGGSDHGDDSSGADTEGGNTDTGSESNAESGTAPPTECSTSLASDVALRDIALFQVLGAPVLADSRPVSAEVPLVPLVADRAAVLRASLSLPADGTPRSLAVVVRMQGPGGEETFRDQRMVDASGGPPFVVQIPADVVQQDTTYSVSVVECGEFSGGAPSPQARFPQRGEATLPTVSTGPIKIHFVPFEVGGFVPDTSEAVLDGFRDAVLAVYPATAVELSVGPVVPDQSGGVLDMGDLLVELGVHQEQDGAAPDVYYYGLVTGAATREEFCSDCPTGTSEAGLGNRAAFALGAAFADQRAEDTLIHELGHMHGLLHAPCGDPDDPDPRFPHPGAQITTEGYDFRTGQFVPADHIDMMAYCYPRWVSDYSYRKLVDWVQLAQTWAGD
ncbi:MAG: M66 family metalloprotease [Myxococcota bacterium]